MTDRLLLPALTVDHLADVAALYAGSRAWIGWAKSADGIDSLIANIAPGNAPSIALAERLGFAFERHDVTPTGKPTLIYRLPTT